MNFCSTLCARACVVKPNESALDNGINGTEDEHSTSKQQEQNINSKKKKKNAFVVVVVWFFFFLFFPFFFFRILKFTKFEFVPVDCTK